MRTRLSLIAATAISASLALLATSPAAALDDGGGYEPPDNTDRADLRVTALAASPSGGNWSITYTVANSGQAAAGPTKLALGGATAEPLQISLTSLAAGASRSGAIQVARARCYVLLAAKADAADAVREQSETNNGRSAVGVAPPCPPRYRITAASFKALDESGYDWTGSDEPYWIFNTVSNGGTASSKASQVYGGIDSGDTQAFSAADSCLWGCGAAGAEAPFGVGLHVELWEKDLGHVEETLYDVAEAFQAVGPIASVAGAPAWVGAAISGMGKAMDFILGWADDDLLGSATYAYSADYLASALPSRGSSFTDTRTYENGDARYTLTMVVNRIV